MHSAKGLNSRLELRSSESNRLRACLRPLPSQVLFTLRAWLWLQNTHTSCTKVCMYVCVHAHVFSWHPEVGLWEPDMSDPKRKKTKQATSPLAPPPQSPKWSSPYRPHPLCITSWPRTFSPTHQRVRGLWAPISASAESPGHGPLGKAAGPLKGRWFPWRPVLFSDASKPPIGWLFSRNLTPLRFRRNFSFCQVSLLSSCKHMLVRSSLELRPRGDSNGWGWLLTNRSPSRPERRSICLCAGPLARGNRSPSSLGATPVNDALAFSLEHHVTGTRRERPFLVTI